MWIGTGAWSVLGYNQWKIYCQVMSSLEATVADACLDIRLNAGFSFAIFALRMFSFISWAINCVGESDTVVFYFSLVLIYYIPLAVLACRAVSKGKPVWWEGVSTTRFGYEQNCAGEDVQWRASQVTLQGGEEFKKPVIDEDLKRVRMV
jgi:hypothetical protein